MKALKPNYYQVCIYLFRGKGTIPLVQAKNSCPQLIAYLLFISIFFKFGTSQRCSFFLFSSFYLNCIQCAYSVYRISFFNPLENKIQGCQWKCFHC